MIETFTKEELQILSELLEYATLDDIQAGNLSFEWCQKWYDNLEKMSEKIEEILNE